MLTHWMVVSFAALELQRLESARISIHEDGSPGFHMHRIPSRRNVGPFGLLVSPPGGRSSSQACSSKTDGALVPTERGMLVLNELVLALVG